MGHERIGVLPRSMRWDKVRVELSRYATSSDNTHEIAQNIIKNVRDRFQDLVTESGSLQAVKYLLILSSYYKGENLNKDKHIIKKNSSPLKLIQGFNEFSKDTFTSREYEAIIKSSLASSLAKYYSSHNLQQENLFQESTYYDSVWQKLNDAKGFCEITRYYFANLTENYLKYFLDREASAYIKNFEIRQRLSDSISLHSFETARIVQSFAAGWFNKNTKKGIPSNSLVKKFLIYSSYKIRSELLREERS